MSQTYKKPHEAWLIVRLICLFSPDISSILHMTVSYNLYFHPNFSEYKSLKCLINKATD